VRQQTALDSVPDGGALDSLSTDDRAKLCVIVAALRLRDHETFAHSRRTARLSLLLGRELEMTRAELTTLFLGALLHDVGKIAVPDAVLHKPGRLTAEEWDAMRRHPADGQRLLAGLDFLDGAAVAVLQHHESWDGTGYPAGLRAVEIDPAARALAVADAYDVMTHHRDYRPARRTHEEAVAELERCAGTQFDPHVVRVFCRLAERLPSRGRVSSMTA
jgi:HD-GYP domain-containing protein (c-di-GMP phosphodiesterase class II)